MQDDALSSAMTWMRANADAVAQPSNQHEHDLAVMFSLLRSFKPDAYIELGRGQGCSTLMASMALAANGRGRVISYDLHKNLGHDLFNRMQGEVPVDLRVGDIRNLTPVSWGALTEGCKRVAVLVDAHEETGEPVSDVLIPYVKAHPEIQWVLMFHDVLYVEDDDLFAAFGPTYQKLTPFVSPYPEYARIFAATKDMEPTHFARLGAEMDLGDVRTHMTEGRSAKHRFTTALPPDEIDRRFSALRSSAMMAVFA